MGYSERIRRAAYDTSALMLLYNSVRVFDDVAALLASNPECLVPRQVLEELTALAGRASSLHRRRAARLALSAVRSRCRVVDVEAATADDALVKLALEDGGLIVVTADNELRRRLRELGLPNIYYRRSRHGMELEG